MKKLTLSEIESELQEFPDWKLNSSGQIEREFSFKDFKESIFFVNSISYLAEKHQHHPDIKIFYNKVIISVNTHDVGGISKKDFELANSINFLLS